MFSDPCMEPKLEDRIIESLWQSWSGQDALVENGGLGAGVSGGSRMDNVVLAEGGTGEVPCSPDIV